MCIELPLFSKKLQGVKTALEQWIFLIKHLHELDNIPEKYKNEIFEQLFEMAKIARMNREEVNSYINSLNELNMIQYEMNRRDNTIVGLQSTVTQQGNTITQQGNTITQQGNTITQQGNVIVGLQAKLAEYERRYGTLNGANP